MKIIKLIGTLVFVLSVISCAQSETLTETVFSSKPPPKSIDELRVARRNVVLESLGEIDGGPGFSSELYLYSSAGLKVHALVARPAIAEPQGGYPVIIANHGHHPEPPKYGITADGKDWRPGDYYRRIPELFTSRGYVVVMPDFRGHNNSEGFEFTEGYLESAYYTEDVLNLINGLSDLDGLNQGQFFMWGHSMGGEVTLRSLMATDRIKAASMWSSVGGDIWDQAYYYSRYAKPDAPDSSETDKKAISLLRSRILKLDGDFDTKTSEPLLYLRYLETPVIIHHAAEDRGAAYKWSERLAKTLYMAGKSYEFWTYPGSDHLFSDDYMELAADRDDTFFRSWL